MPYTFEERKQPQIHPCVDEGQLRVGTFERDEADGLGRLVEPEAQVADLDVLLH